MRDGEIAMNESEIAEVLKARGYRKVTVKAFSKSTRIHAETSEWSEVRNVGVPVSEIDWRWLNDKYPEVVEGAPTQ